MVYGSTNKHDWLCQKIYDTPDIIGVNDNDIIAKMREVGLVYKKHLLTIPDVVLYGKDTRHYVEVKSAHTAGGFSKGMSQLEKIAHWHNFYGKSEPDIKLVMAPDVKTKYWVDLLDDLQIYKPGDSFRG